MEINPVLVGTYVTIARDVVVTIAAVITASIAIYGLRIWKRDLVGKESYEAAKTLVFHSHATVRALLKLRLPIGDHERMMLTKEQIEHTTESERWRLTEAAAYRVKLKDFMEVYSGFREALLNMRVIAGSQVFLAFQPFQKAIRSNLDKLYAYLVLLEDFSVSYIGEPDDVKVTSKFVCSFDGSVDELQLSVEDTRESGEIFLLPYLHRKSISK